MTLTKKPGTAGPKVIGREKELRQLVDAVRLGRNLLIEGPVGVGKTFLVLRALEQLKKKFERVDGDSRYSEQKMTGWFDPPLVLKKGYVPNSFIAGPLINAMKNGSVLFINELNRMPEAVQNILLPAMDERRVAMPKLGEIEAKPGFLVIATQNPREFTATHALSEALLDRFEMIHLNYQTRAEELEILEAAGTNLKSDVLQRILDLVRSTRSHAPIKRGASLRAGLAICELMSGGMDFKTSVMMALPSRIELVSSDDSIEDILNRLMSAEELPLDQKKKELRN